MIKPLPHTRFFDHLRAWGEKLPAFDSTFLLAFGIGGSPWIVPAIRVQRLAVIDCYTVGWLYFQVELQVMRSKSERPEEEQGGWDWPIDGVNP